MGKSTEQRIWDRVKIAQLILLAAAFLLFLGGCGREGAPADAAARTGATIQTGTATQTEAVTQTGTATNGKNAITVQVNNAGITYDGGTYWCDVAPKNISGRILVPIRAISESAGCKVFWNQTMKKVIIES